ncbi:related to MFS amino acid transporter [Cephalotrichum gorgonifer]|uniref:Related to MFS amino acid transporter n=1 Tax=Cephalotrichum gorgonifer TaxID=2041049 RepID=A0AAE8SR90_9PEZI|nr:related to MFS amino acid transporter [Cephalotrichum gorgonifer]
MSLNRVSSVESLVIAPRDVRGRRESAASLGSVRRNKLSFNPLPRPEWELDETAGAETVAAFEVPKWKRLLQVGATVAYSLFAAGIVFGYAAIKPVLKSEGAYRDLCSSDATSEHDVDVCVEIRLNFMFTVAAVASNLAALPIGALLDRHGPRTSGILGSAFLTAGSILMANARHLRFDGFLAGYLLLALGGPAVFISSFHLSNAFPAHSGLILALVTGAFDASSALFLAYRLVYERTGGALGIDRFFTLYLVVPAVIFLLNVFLLPAQSYKTVGELVADADAELEAEASRESARPSSSSSSSSDEHTMLLPSRRRTHPRRGSVAAEVQDLLGSGGADAQLTREGRKNDASGVWGAMHGSTALQQLRSPWFVLIALFTVLQMTRINYFIATVRPQYEVLLGSRRAAAELNNFFDAALPAGGLVAVPLIGLLLDNARSVTVLSALVAAATAIGVLGVVPAAWAAYANVVLFVVYRPMYYTAISDLAAKVFGFQTFGTVYGTLISLSGVFGFSQYALDHLFHVTFRGDPVPVNVMLLSAGAAVGAALVGYVAWQARGLRRKLLEDEAEAAFVFDD